MIKGFFAGSFDPVTLGHEDIIKRASKFCDKLTVGIVVNQSKASMFTLDQRLEMMKAAIGNMPNVDVVAFDGHLTTYVINHGYNCIIRGLRNKEDFDYELQLSHIYANIPKDGVETLYLMTSAEYSYVSSTIVRENFKLGGDVSAIVSPEVLELMNKFK